MHDEMKKVAAKKAADMIEDSMTLGLGTGSTASYFIEALIDKVKKGLKIKAAVSSSKVSEELAKKGGIAISDINEVSHINLTVDGADEVDGQKRLIKGGGGALLREKILATSSHEMWVIADEQKLSKKLGKHPLPVEVIYFGHKMTQQKIEALNLKGSFRTEKNGNYYVTENGNLIYDIQFNQPIDDPEKIHEQLIHIVGVVETGLFFHLAKKIILGCADGSTKILG